MPVTPTQEWEYWDTKLTEASRTELETVQKAAAGWTALFGAVLGIFGAVAFAGGLKTLDDLVAPWDVAAKVLTSVAVLAGLVATYAAAKASAGLSPQRTHTPSALDHRERARKAAGTHLSWLRAAKVAGLVAAVAVVGGSAMVLWVGEPAPKAPKVVALVDGRAVCGRLTADGDTLKVGGTVLDDTTISVTVVTACP